MNTQKEIKVGEVYYLPVRVTSRNENMEAVFYAAEIVGSEGVPVELSPDGARVLYLRAEQLVKED